MTQQTVHPRYVFDIKSSNLSLVALVLRSTDLTLLSRDFDLRFGAMPNFFDQEGVVIDLSQACSTRGGCGSGNLETALEFSVLIDLLRSHQLRPVAIRGGNEQQIAAALANGLVHTAREPERSLPTKKPEPAESRERVVGGVPADPVVVERQVRCGQQIYAKGRDLVILGMVNPGAEVVADGNIHIYAPCGDARSRAQAAIRQLVSLPWQWSRRLFPLRVFIAREMHHSRSPWWERLRASACLYLQPVSACRWRRFSANCA